MANRGDRFLGEILILDDEYYKAESLAEILERELHCTAVPSDKPRESVAQRLDRPYDLVITDLRMGDRDGLAVLAEIKAMAPECEVMLVTQYGTYDSAITAMRLGAIDYVQRDPSSEEWLEQILWTAANVLRYRPARREPHHHRENLIQFFLERTQVNPSGRSSTGGEFEPGVALEYAAKLLLESSQLKVRWHRWRTATEEHDLICENPAQGPFWRFQAPVVLVECKDYAMKTKDNQRPGANERGRFEQKIVNRKGQSSLGFFISSNGFAKTFKTVPVPSPVAGGPMPVVVPIGGADIQAWVEAEDRFEWLTGKAVEAAL